MPYIKQADRNRLDRVQSPITAGELNYCLHIMLEQYYHYKGDEYQTYNDMLGALEGALEGVKLELYRRHVAGYEDKKIVENGDIQFYENADIRKLKHHNS